MTFDPFIADPLRVDSWAGFVGQENLKSRLETHIASALTQNRAPGHILLIANPGCGKTSLARLIAFRAGMAFDIKTMPVKSTEIFFTLIFDKFEGVMLLDEIHRSSVKEQEELFTLLESNYVQYRGEKFMLGKLCVVGATTEPKKLIRPLRERFKFAPSFDAYTVEELGKIVSDMCLKLGTQLTKDEAEQLGGACGGTPRLAGQIATAARDIRVVTNAQPTVESILDYLRIDEDGVGVEHWNYLRALFKLGGEAGLKPIANYLGEDESYVESLEKLLLQLDLISYGGRGRVLKPEGSERLKQHG